MSERVSESEACESECVSKRVRVSESERVRVSV